MIKTLPPGALTSYPQGKSLFRSRKQLNLAIERLEDTLATCSSRLTELESQAKRLELEWVETYDKIRHQLSRMARRGDLTKANGPDESVQEGAPEDDGMDPISRKIHARRNRMFMGGK